MLNLGTLSSTLGLTGSLSDPGVSLPGSLMSSLLESSTLLGSSTSSSASTSTTSTPPTVVEETCQAAANRSNRRHDDPNDHDRHEREKKRRKIKESDVNRDMFEERFPRERGSGSRRHYDAIHLAGGVEDDVGMQSTLDFLSSVQEDVHEARDEDRTGERPNRLNVESGEAPKAKSEIDIVLKLLENVADEIQGYQVTNKEMDEARRREDNNMEDMREGIVSDFEQEEKDDVEGPRLVEVEKDDLMPLDLKRNERWEKMKASSDKKEYVITEADFQNVELDVFLKIFDDLRRKIFRTEEEVIALVAVARHLKASITLAHLYDFHLGLENWTSKSFCHKPKRNLVGAEKEFAFYTVIEDGDKNITCVYRDSMGEKKRMLVYEVMLYSNDTLKMVMNELNKRLQLDKKTVHEIAAVERHLMRYFVKEIDERLRTMNDLKIAETNKSLGRRRVMDPLQFGWSSVVWTQMCQAFRVQVLARLVYSGTNTMRALDDELIYMGNNSALCDRFKTSMNQIWEGCTISWESKFNKQKGEYLYAKYPNDVLARFGMENCNPLNNPIVPRTKLAKEGVAQVDSSLYKQLISTLMFGLLYEKGSIENLKAYIHSDLLELLMVLEVHLSTLKFKKTTYCDSLNQSGQSIWMNEILDNLNESQNKGTPILCDNIFSIKLSKNCYMGGRNTSRSDSFSS
ncbi:LOW QUALITY PROTEIN: hypothetical protein OSB04_023816 [Centaurea solstitialis]|uniref:Uncharacterized protein n=1 Tax=Centaurea solstitialis TaxID=347529 RepID=A0AA38SJX5_9ASTR|nr:LOW QUALITY PROTEIN: hypothetical protein OSB04_023816 [Centaurea solstitialis]